MLFGADDRENADDLLKQLPALADQPQDRRDTVRDWITSLYPPIDARPWGSLPPDRLVERFVGTRLAVTPGLVDPILDVATQAQIERMLTVYARVANHPAADPCLAKHLTDLCIRHRHILGPSAMKAATQVEAPSPLNAAIHAIVHVIRYPGTTLDEVLQTAYRLGLVRPNLPEWVDEQLGALTNWAQRLEHLLRHTRG